MPTFEVEILDIVARTYRIEATDLAAAVAKGQEGEGVIIGSQTELIGLCESVGVSIHELGLSQQAVEQAGVAMDDDLVIGVRAAREVGVA